MWISRARLEAIEDHIVAQDRRVKALEILALEYEKMFAALEVRLSGPTEQVTEIPTKRDTDWLTERKRLTEQYAAKGENGAE